MSCSLTGVYMIPACLSSVERSKQYNIYSITLSLYRSNLYNIISILKGLSALDQGVEMEISINNKPQKLFVFAYALSFLGDMPQQQFNAGFKS